MGSDELPPQARIAEKKKTHPKGIRVLCLIPTSIIMPFEAF
jgi:hypothetical protein